MWSSEPTGIGAKGQPKDGVRGDHLGNEMEVTSVMSFASSSGGAPLDRSLGSPERKCLHNNWRLRWTSSMAYWRFWRVKSESTWAKHFWPSVVAPRAVWPCVSL
ncbi:unnamed protein product, partial [Callosobruchus maculatus]